MHPNFTPWLRKFILGNQQDIDIASIGINTACNRSDDHRGERDSWIAFLHQSQAVIQHATIGGIHFLVPLGVGDDLFNFDEVLLKVRHEVFEIRSLEVRSGVAVRYVFAEVVQPTK